MPSSRRQDTRSPVERERDERVKELRCLYNLANELEKARSLEELLLNVVYYLKEAVQFPEICSVRIEHDESAYGTSSRKRPIVRSIIEKIVVQKQDRGNLCIHYHADEPFLKEEYALAASISKILARAVERFEFEKAREDYTRKLEALVEDRVRELQRSRARYKSLYDNAPVGICISTADGEVLSANRAFYLMFGFPGDGSRVPHMVRDNLYCTIDDRDFLVSELEEKMILSDYEVKMRALDGSVLAVSLSSIRYEDDGVTCYESILKDITEKKRLEEKLKKQKDELKIQIKKRTKALVAQRDKVREINKIIMGTTAELESSISKMRTLFSAITDRVMSIDRNYTIQMTNQDDRDEGKKCHDVVFGNPVPCKKCPAVRAVKSKKPSSIEVQKDEHFYLLQCYPILDQSGEVEGVIEWAKDVTDEKNIHNQMLQADRLASLGQLVSGIGHEINNPNTFILGNMKIVREAFADMIGIVDNHYKDHRDLKIARLEYQFFKEHIHVLMDDMVNGALRIKLIVEDLKKFARKQEEKLVDSVSLNQVVESSIRLVHNQVKRKASIVTELDEQIPLVRANPLGLEQVVVNLIINASDAIQDGERGTIRINTSLDGSGEYVLIVVRDNGIGMDQATMKQIFNPFFTTKRGHGGTGLGLSISYRIVKEHDGEMEVTSIPGSGTAFTVMIPVTNGTGPQA